MIFIVVGSLVSLLSGFLLYTERNVTDYRDLMGNALLGLMILTGVVMVFVGIISLLSF
jgi:hypothetical protein